MIHTFLRSIGFGDLTKNADLYLILESILNRPDEQNIVKDEYGNEFACFSKSFGTDIGITVCGNFINDKEFRMEYYYPYLHGSQITTCETIEIERHAAREAFAGICDELKLGVTLIFYIENIADILHARKNAVHNTTTRPDNAVLAGLSTGGKILLPIMKTSKQLANKEKSSEKRLSLMKQARDGNKSAMENLTMNDMDLYSSLSRRIMKEDVLSIVESSFIPYGIESDQYVVIGEILNFYESENSLTNEKLWILNLNCNNLVFDICINQNDLLGEPQVGRRFKGRIWLQGHVNFEY
ncbi:MAG: DUF3881 family protein [Eubacterium sp.]